MSHANRAALLKPRSKALVFPWQRLGLIDPGIQYALPAGAARLRSQGFGKDLAGTRHGMATLVLAPKADNVAYE